MKSKTAVAIRSARRIRTDRIEATQALRRSSPPRPRADPVRAEPDGEALLRAARRLRLGVAADVTPLFLALGLRELGHDARLHLGREYAPRDRPATYYHWVQVGDNVVSTSEPVREVFQTVVELPDGQTGDNGGTRWTPMS